MTTVREVLDKKDLKAFVRFPFSLYKKNPYWVPPIIAEEMETFDSEKNPAFETASARLFIAESEGKVVGRIAAILNHWETQELKIPKIRFGWFDFIDDIEVSQALIAKVSEIGKEAKAQFMEGPMGFSNMDKVGLLVEGFDHIGSMATWYNHPYYPNHYLKMGFVKEKGYLENSFLVKNADPALFLKANLLIKKRFGLREVCPKTTNEVLGFADQMFDLFNTTYSKLSSFVPITERQKEYFKEKYLTFINPEYIKYILDANDKLIAFTVVMPSFSRALQKANGRLFPFGFLYLLWAKKFSKDAIFYLIGIHPDYQSKGVTAIIFNEYYKTFTQRGVTHCYRTPELEDNIAIRQMWKHFDPKVFKKRNTYRKSL